MPKDAHCRSCGSRLSNVIKTRETSWQGTPRVIETRQCRHCGNVFRVNY